MTNGSGVSDWPDTGESRRSDYGMVLDALRILLDDPTDTEIASALKALQQPLRELRASYKSDAVRLEYQPAHSLAYLMAYVPPYIEMAERALKMGLRPAEMKESLEVAFIGAGPGPEVVALSNLAKLTNGQCRNLRVHLIDRATQSWSGIRQALAEVVRSHWPGGSLTIEEHDVDIMKAGIFRDLDSVIRRCDLVMAQNCMNETLAIDARFQENLCGLAEQLNDQGTLILSDQSNYNIVKNRIRIVETFLSSVGSVDRNFGQQIEFAQRETVPRAVALSLLTGADGLKARRNVYFGVSVFRRFGRTEGRGPTNRTIHSDSPRPPMSRAAIVPMDRSQGRRRDLERIRGSQPEVRRELAQLAKKLAPVQGQVVEWRKNGVYVDVAGVQVFIDIADLESRGPLPDPRKYVGRQLAFELVNVGPHSAKGNRRSLLAKQRVIFEQSTNVRDRVIARVSEIRPRSIILEINDVRISVHVSELSHNWITDPAEMFSIDELVEIEITEILNRSNMWAYASVKRCVPNELVEFDSTHKRGELVRCIAVEVHKRFAVLNLLGMEARIHVDHLGELKVGDCRSVFQEGQILWAKYFGFLPRGSKGRYLQVSLNELGGSEKVAREFVDAWNAEMVQER